MTELFPIESVAGDSPRLKAIKAADVQTHHSPHLDDDPWLAIPMHAARERLKSHISKGEPLNSILDVTASYGILLDDSGLIFYGETESEAQDKALASLNQTQTKP
jgi:hypothetical protein